ncbi:MAG: SDR family NAD(P)-dependent oxidoreductase [Chitinophagaceae bacterium]
MGKIVFITGASSGFGAATAKKFAAAGYNLVITGRREDRLESLKEEIEKEYGGKVHPLVFDVQNREAVFASVATLDQEWQQIDVLVNNAGLALGRDLFQNGDIDDWEVMIDTNVKGLLYVTKAIVPFMIARNKGQIINLGSIAGKEAYEKGNVYCASKAAVASISRSLRIDLLSHRIKVTAVHPGAAETEFGIVRFKGNAETASNIYQGYQPLLPEDVADVIFYCASQPEHVCINEIEMTCVAQANSFVTFKTKQG